MSWEPCKARSATVLWHRSADYYRDRPWRGTWAGGGGGLLMNQAIHTVDLLQWLLGDVTSVSGHAATRFLGDTIEVEDTAEFVAHHTGGARSVFYATLAHAVNAPVAIDVITEKAALSLRGDLTVSYHRRPRRGRRRAFRHRPAVGPTGVSPTRSSSATSTPKLHDPEPFWISPREAAKSLRIVQDIYRQSYSQQAPNGATETARDRIDSAARPLHIVTT